MKKALKYLHNNQGNTELTNLYGLRTEIKWKE
ncbi:hypothetical protein FLACHUCJ7_04380 [Flavobacterium chungangense]|uniref:Uncharacterized protein n=1 Tax=Flavobacterium chungangense TaxID=554283 RepID=A0A6V6ZDM0_9FLAO|nr:hypothetical protein FLACHUCJ7_04380 [Flavobacterium chungangense]